MHKRPCTCLKTLQRRGTQHPSGWINENAAAFERQSPWHLQVAFVKLLFFWEAADTINVQGLHTHGKLTSLVCAASFLLEPCRNSLSIMKVHVCARARDDAGTFAQLSLRLGIDMAQLSSSHQSHLADHPARLPGDKSSKPKPAC